MARWHISYTHQWISTGMYWSAIQDDFYAWLYHVMMALWMITWRPGSVCCCMAEKRPLTSIDLLSPQGYRHRALDWSNLWSRINLCFEKLDYSLNIIFCGAIHALPVIIFLNCIHRLNWSYFSTTVHGRFRLQTSTEYVCMCMQVELRMPFRWWNCQESVIHSGCITLWCGSNMKYLHAFLLFNSIRITALEVELTQSGTQLLKSPFMQNIFEIH